MTERDDGQETGPSQSHRDGPLIFVEEGIRTVDLGRTEDLAEGAPPIRKLVLMILLLALKDRLKEVHFYGGWDYQGERALRLFCLFQKGGLAELLAPPKSCTDPVLNELLGLAGLDTWRSRLGNWLRDLASRLDGQPRPARWARLRFKVGDTRHNSLVYVYPSDKGPWIVVAMDRDTVLSMNPSSVYLNVRQWEVFEKLAREAEEAESRPGETKSPFQDYEDASRAAEENRD